MARTGLTRATATQVALGVVALLVLLLPIKAPFNIYDEGFAVLNATRILSGDRPYRDFWTIYPPGQFYVLAAWFKVFGTSLMTARVYDTLVRLAVLTSVYLIARHQRFASLPLLAVSAVTLVLLASASFYTYAVFPSLSLGLFSILATLNYATTGRKQSLAVAGILVGFTGLFRWDIAIYAAIAVTATTLCASRRIPVGQHTDRPNMRSYGFVSLRPVLVGALAILVPFYAYLCVTSGFANVWQQIIVFPVWILHSVRGLPYPALLPVPLEALADLAAYRSIDSEAVKWLFFYLPPAIFGLASVVLVRTFLRQRVLPGGRSLAPVALVSFGALLFLQAWSRYDFVHVIPTSIVAVLTVGSIANVGLANGRGRLSRTGPLALLSAASVLYLVAPVDRLVSSLARNSPFDCHSALIRANCIALNADQENAVQFVAEHTRSGEHIFVGNRRHDSIFVNDIGFYFLSDRASATSQHELYPGVATTMDVQKRIARDLSSKHVNVVVLVDLPLSKEPNASAMSSGIEYLDDYIASNYATVSEFGKYKILQRTANLQSTGLFERAL